MLDPRRLVLLAFGLGVAGLAFACGGGTDIERPSTTGEIVAPESGLEVSATLAAVSLDDRSANMQIAFFAGDATAPASVEIARVDLLDGKTGAELETLTATTPQVWNGRTYERWNEKVTPGGDLKASYELSAPNWSRTGSTSYSTPYRLRVTLRIDGAEVVISSETIQREPPVAT